MNADFPLDRHELARNPSRLLLLATGVFFLACAIFYNEWLVVQVGKVLRTELQRSFKIPAPSDIRWIQLAFVVAALVAFIGAHVVAASQRADRFTRRPRVQRTFLAFLTPLVLFYTLECGLRPFASQMRKTTSLFVKDDELGWRLRANASENWDGVVVRTNAKGLRGPEMRV